MQIDGSIYLVLFAIPAGVCLSLFALPLFLFYLFLIDAQPSSKTTEEREQDSTPSAKERDTQHISNFDAPLLAQKKSLPAWAVTALIFSAGYFYDVLSGHSARAPSRAIDFTSFFIPFFGLMGGLDAPPGHGVLHEALGLSVAAIANLIYLVSRFVRNIMRR
jgi:hypothetical protein